MNKLQQFHGLIGESTVFMKMMTAIEKIARYDTSVLLSGETGSGKELAARAIHYRSPRHDKPFIPVNCGALPDHLIENELFGHARGAYTDARDTHSGLVAQAEGGTLFLDEIDTLSPKAQITLLRFLQDGQYRALGGNKLVCADVRILSACNANLDQLVEAGTFRPDLHYRLKVMELAIPPLRAREGDAVLLARHFIAETARHYGLPAKDLHPDTQHWLASQSWPGNIRELQHLIQREFLLSDQDLIHIQTAPPATERRRKLDRRQADLQTLNFNEAKRHILASFERKHLIQLMHAAAGNVSQAARLAGKERRALGKLLKKHHIEPQQFRAA